MQLVFAFAVFHLRANATEFTQQTKPVNSVNTHTHTHTKYKNIKIKAQTLLMSNTKPNKPNLQIQSIHINETLPFSHRQAKPKLSKLYTSLPATLEMPPQRAKRLRRTRTLPNQTPSLASMLIAGGRSVYRRPSRCKSLNISLNTVHSDVAADCPADWRVEGYLPRVPATARGTREL